MLRTNAADVFIGCVFLLLQVRMEEALLLGERAIGERDSARAEADGIRAQLQDALEVRHGIFFSRCCACENRSLAETGSEWTRER